MPSRSQANDEDERRHDRAMRAAFSLRDDECRDIYSMIDAAGRYCEGRLPGYFRLLIKRRYWPRAMPIPEARQSQRAARTSFRHQTICRRGMTFL